MPKLYLPFYDLGSGVGAHQPNNAMDIALCSFLLDKVKTKLPKIPLPPAHLYMDLSHSMPKIDWKRGHFNEWLAKAINNMGYTCSLSSGNTIEPASKNKFSPIVALNAIYCKQDLGDYLNPSFFSTSNAIVVGSLQHHMWSARSMRSRWFGTSATQSGPQRELPFYDLTSSLYNNPSPPNGQPQVFDGLCSYLLKLIINGNSPAKPAQASSPASMSPNVSINMAMLAPFAEKCAQLGWPSSAVNCVHPTMGNTGCDSLMIPMNYFAYKVTETGNFAGTTYGQYIHPFNTQPFPQSVARALLSNWSSLYF